MKRPDSLGSIAIVAFAVSFLFPGVRVADVPISLASFISLLFLPGALSAYSASRLRLVILCLFGLIFLIGRNALLYGLEMRNILYLLLPLSAIGAVVVVKKMVDVYGLALVQLWAMILCGINLLVMIAQAMNLGDIVMHLEAIWAANIAFVVNDENQAEILWHTIQLRPPGLFPTGIFASTVIYIVCRSVLLTQLKTWPLLIAMLAILFTANRTLAAVFLIYESIALIYKIGVIKFSARALMFVVISAVSLVLVTTIGGELYLITFLYEEVGGGAVANTASVVERLKTLEIFLAYAPEYLAFGGFSSSALINEGHVFDSELMLRSLQFGMFGVIFMVFIVLVPRVGHLNRSWNFLFFLALLASITTTFMTSIVYIMAIALYKEALVRVKVENKGTLAAVTTRKTNV